MADTGAGMSLIPQSCVSGTLIKPTAVSITTASGQRPRVFGEATLDVPSLLSGGSSLGLFVVTEVAEPLLANDFLSRHSLIVGCGAQTLRRGHFPVCAWHPDFPAFC